MALAPDQAPCFEVPERRRNEPRTDARLLKLPVRCDQFLTPFLQQGTRKCMFGEQLTGGYRTRPFNARKECGVNRKASVAGSSRAGLQSLLAGRAGGRNRQSAAAQ